jgi:hypothetical protein
MYKAQQFIQGNYVGFSDGSGLDIHANGLPLELELGNFFYLYGEIDLVGTGKTIISVR